MIDGRDFGAYRPVVITGELRRDIMNNVYSGAMYKVEDNLSGGVYRYVMAGLGTKQLASVGYDSVNDLSILHSMHSANKLDIVVFHRQPHILCFRLTELMRIQIAQQSQLQELKRIPWGLFEIKDFELDLPTSGRFEFLGKQVAYDELETVFKKIEKDGWGLKDG